MQVFISAYMYAEIRGFAKLIKPPQESNVGFYAFVFFWLQFFVTNEISMRGQIRKPTEKMRINTVDERIW